MRLIKLLIPGTLSRITACLLISAIPLLHLEAQINSCDILNTQIDNHSFEDDATGTSLGNISGWSYRNGESSWGDNLNADWTKTPNDFEVEVVGTHAFEGNQSVRFFLEEGEGCGSSIWRYGVQELYSDYVATTSDSISLWVRDVNFSTPSRYAFRFSIVLDDGPYCNVARINLFCDSELNCEGCPGGGFCCCFDNNSGTVLGDDGAMWTRYTIGIPATINKDYMRVRIRHFQNAWDGNCANAEFYVDNICFSDGVMAPGNPPDTLKVTVDSITHVLCGSDSTGEVFIDVEGGDRPYNYSWSNSSTDSNLTGVPAGTYTVTVNDVNGNCADVASATITEPDTLEISVDTIMHLLCASDSTGAIFVDVVGGDRPYNYAWSNGSADSTLTGAPAGTYTVTVNDTKGCADTTGATITAPDSLEITVDAITHVGCAGDSTGELFIDVEGGNRPYTYAWSNGSADSTLTGAPAGTYTVTVTDANSCEDTTTATITAPDSLKITVDATTHVWCAGDSTGEVFVDVEGGTLPYAYAWSDSSTDSNLAGVTAGTYMVIATDANGCEDTASATITVLNNLTVTVDAITHVGCAGDSTGELLIDVAGDDPPYSFAWSDNSTDSNLIGVPAGTYFVTVTDASSCVDTTGATITAPGSLEVTINSITNTCADDSTGEIFIDVVGGVPAYSYTWSNDSTDSTLTGLSSGAYTVTVTDDNGCADTALGEVQAAPLPVADFEADTVCVGDSTTFVNLTDYQGGESGGVTWSLGDGNTAFSEHPSHTYEVADTYHVTLYVTSGAACEDSITWEVIVYDLPAIMVGYDTTINQGQSTPIFAEGGVSYAWTPEASLDDPGAPRPVAAPGVTTTYTVEVTDEQGCSTTDSMRVVVLEETQAEKELFIPNAFSPNEDGVNERLLVYGEAANISSLYLVITNRWGEKVYETDRKDEAMNTGWDGTYRGQMLNTGVYTYFLRVAYPNGEEVIRQGDVTLIR